MTTTKVPRGRDPPTTDRTAAIPGIEGPSGDARRKHTPVRCLDDGEGQQQHTHKQGTHLELKPNTTNPANGNTIQTVPMQDHHQTGAALVRPDIQMASSLASKATTNTPSMPMQWTQWKEHRGQQNLVENWSHQVRG